MKLKNNLPKLSADLLLLALLVLNILAILFVSQVSELDLNWFRIVQGALEGALAGACADWFAVTALFKAPLGISLPHTRIIPRSQKVIADKVAKAISQHFLSDKSLVELLDKIDIRTLLADKLASPQASKSAYRFLAKKIKSMSSGHLIENDNEEVPKELLWIERIQKEYMNELIPDAGKLSGGKWKVWKKENWSSWVYKYVTSNKSLSARVLIEGYFLDGYTNKRCRRDLKTLQDLMFFLSQQSRSNQWFSSDTNGLQSWVLKLAPGLRSTLESHVRQIIEEWDSEYLSQNVESMLGKHLAYIRINGTICGLLVGCLLALLHFYLG